MTTCWSSKALFALARASHFLSLLVWDPEKTWRHSIAVASPCDRYLFLLAALASPSFSKSCQQHEAAFLLADTSRDVVLVC